METVKSNILKILLVISMICCLGSGIFMWNHSAMLESKEDGIAQIEMITSTIQRVSKVELEHSQDDELIASVDGMCEELYSAETGLSMFFGDDEEMLVLAQKIVGDWEELKVVIAQYRESANRDLLFSASEENYINSNATISKISRYVDEYSNDSGVTRILMFASAICVVILLILMFINTHKELEKNKEISKDMHLDIATGIYNQAKCHEILKTSYGDRKKEMAVIVFDLNDLKKTNDGLGHRAGDQLIYDFAQQIKNATMKFENEIFVGRYGGDEFMAFLDEIEEQDVKNYIDNVYKILKEFNETQGRPYQLSCAAGYGITSEDNKSATAKELFDIADEDMFKNKIAMKEKKKQELMAQGIEVEEHVDDRLS